MNVFFDVQGTLISGGGGRPMVREAFEALISDGHHVYIWSSGGGGYARSAAESLGVDDLVFGYFSKNVPLPVSVDFAVDDYPDLVFTHGGFTVPPYTGDPDDRVLMDVVEAVREQAS